MTTTTINTDASTTVNQNNSSANQTDTIAGNGSDTVNLNNSAGNDTVTIAGNGSDTVNLNNSTGNDTITIAGNGTDAVNANNSTGNDTIMITGTGTDTVNLNNSKGDDVISSGDGNDTINLNNSSGNLVVYGGAGNDTINANNSTGSDVFIGGAGNNVINGGAGNDLEIYALSEHYSINPSGQLQNIAGDCNYYYGNGGSNTLRMVATAAEYALVYNQLYAYQQWLAAKPAASQTYSFTFGTNSVGLVVGGFQNFVIELINPLPTQNAGVQMNATGSVLTLFQDVTDNNTGAVQNATSAGAVVVGITAGAGATGTSLDPTRSQMTSLDQYLASGGKVGSYTPTAFTGTVSGTYGTLSIDAKGNYTYHVTSTTTSGYDTFTFATEDGYGFLTATTLTFFADPTPPTMSWGSGKTSGVEGSPIVLETLVATDAVGITSLVVSGATAGTVLTDGSNSHTFTGLLDSVDIHTWNLQTLKITPASDANFTLTAVATDSVGNTNSGTEAVTVNPLAPTVAPVAENGIEGSALALNLGISLNGLSGDGNALYSVTISGIPVGATLSNSHHDTLTISGGSITFNASQLINGVLSGLTITPPNDANFALTVAATEKDAEGNLSTITTNTEAVIVNPLAPTVAPAAKTGVEGSAIALNLGVSVNGLSGDSNTLNSLVVGAIPVGATLSDGAGGHSFAASVGSTSVDVKSWSLSSLRITPPNDTNFMLSVSVTEKDGAGDISPTAINAEAVTVDPLAPIVSITGNAQEGQVLAARASTADADVSITYQWQRSSDGVHFSDISGATTSTYVPTENDEGRLIRVHVVSTDTEGDGNTATSAATAAVLDAAPTVTTPVISGTAQEGQTLTASASAGQPDNPVSYQWQQDGHDIAGATGATYLVTEGDEGHKLDIVATATNEQGLTATVTSAATATVLDAAPTVTTPLISG